MKPLLYITLAKKEVYFMTTEESILKLFDNVFKDSNLDYDVVEIVFQYKGNFSIKFYIENLGTVMDSFDYNSLKETLIDFKSKILKNALKCPFCESIEIKEDICKCGATFIKSNSCSGDDSIINSYQHFDDFIDKIETHTKLTENTLSVYTAMSGNIIDIVSGVGVIYKGMSKYPIFVLSEKISLKYNINEEARKKLFYAKLSDETNVDFSIYYDYHYKNTNVHLVFDEKIIVKFQYDPISFDEFSGSLNILIPFDQNELFNIYTYKYGIDKNDGNDYDDIMYELKDWFTNNYLDDAMIDTYNHDEYIAYSLNISENNENYEMFLTNVKKYIDHFKNILDLNNHQAIDDFDKFHLSLKDTES